MSSLTIGVAPVGRFTDCPCRKPVAPAVSPSDPTVVHYAAGIPYGLLRTAEISQPKGTRS
jgi:hypothetical protein